MFKNKITKRLSLVVAGALALGVVSSVGAQAVGSINTPSAATQILGAITRTSLTTWSEPVTFNITSTALAAGQTVAITEANSGTSTATNVVATAGSYTLVVGDVTSATNATFSTMIVYTSSAATQGAETAALGTQTLTPTIATFVASASGPVTIPGNPNLQATIANSFTGTTATQVAGPANTVTITNYSPTNSVYYTIAGGVTSAVGNTAGTNSGSVVAGGAGTISIATTAVGTITVTGYVVINGAASTVATDTVTITVIGAVAGTVYGSSTLLGASGTTTPTVNTDAAFSVNAASGASAVANFTLVEYDGSTTPVQLNSGYKSIMANVTNGLLTSSGGITTGSGTTYIGATPVAASTNFVLSSINGLSGVSTITFAVNGVTLKTYSVTFTGAATKIVLTAINPVVAQGSAATLLSSSASITANTNALEVQEFDVNGNPVVVNTANLVVTSTATATATAGAFDTLGTHTLGDIVAGKATSSTIVGVSVNGVTAGNATFTATDSTLSLTSNPVTVRVSSAVPTKVVIASDMPAYADGGAGTLTTTISDAVGTLPAGTYVVFTGQATSSLALTVGASTLPGAPATLVGPPAVTIGQVTVNDNGVYTSSFNAPLSDGTVNILASPLNNTITVTPVSFTTASGSAAASKAATDAAIAATKAAVAAGVSADAATAAATDAGAKASAALIAVTALSQQVTALTSKIVAITSLITQIVKKLNAKAVVKHKAKTRK